MRKPTIVLLFLTGLVSVLLLFSFNSISNDSQENHFRFDSLVVAKKERKMTAWFEGSLQRTYKISLGKNPVGHKQFEGDFKTPEGLYRINDKNPNSGFYKNLGISYPNAADREYAKLHGKSTGGSIKIHGMHPKWTWLGKLHRIRDWTNGCIAVTDKEMEELYRGTPVGTPILILP